MTAGKKAGPNPPAAHAPIAAAEVIKWFRRAITSRPIPTEEQVAKIVETVNLLRAMRAPGAMTTVAPHYEIVMRSYKEICAATPHIARARQHLAAALEIAVATGEPVAAILSLEASLLTSLDAYLAKHKPRGRGRAERTWDFYLCVLKVDLVRDALLAAGWPAASIVTDDGPVCKVFSRALGAASGHVVAPTTLARFFRRNSGE